MNARDWRDRRRGWSASPVAEGYDQRRFASVLGRRKHRNDVARLLDTLAHHLPSPGRGPGGLILDLPCGTGRLGAELMAAGYRVVGADLAPVMLSQAAASAASPMHLLCAEAEHLPLPAAAVDHLFCGPPPGFSIGHATTVGNNCKAVKENIIFFLFVLKSSNPANGSREHIFLSLWSGCPA
ncbi:MAG: class I SAM-dependent methyltransferase, partial [Planctomycetota bacterium]|nr:class I SAM-dependent methyltransferase [Planctomycetota bacterium]